MENDKTTAHETINFVDDSSSVMANDDPDELECYMTEYLYLLKSFYSSNKLKLNPSKSQFLLQNHPEASPQTNIQLKLKIEGEDEIINSKQIKILGWWVSESGSYAAHLSKVKLDVYDNIR